MLTERLSPPRHLRRLPHTAQLEGQWSASTKLPVYSSLAEWVSVCSQSHHPDPHNGDPDIWQGIVCCGNASSKKYRDRALVYGEMTHLKCVDAKSRPEALGSDVMGVGKATSGSITDKLTRDHRLTLDEAHMILNTKKEDPLEQIRAVSAELLSHFP